MIRDLTSFWLKLKWPHDGVDEWRRSCFIIMHLSLVRVSKAPQPMINTKNQWKQMQRYSYFIFCFWQNDPKWLKKKERKRGSYTTRFKVADAGGCWEEEMFPLAQFGVLSALLTALTSVLSALLLLALTRQLWSLRWSLTRDKDSSLPLPRGSMGWPLVGETFHWLFQVGVRAFPFPFPSLFYFIFYFFEEF